MYKCIKDTITTIFIISNSKIFLNFKLNQIFNIYFFNDFKSFLFAYKLFNQEHTTFKVLNIYKQYKK
jgi:hypothetical protein